MTTMESLHISFALAIVIGTLIGAGIGIAMLGETSFMVWGITLTGGYAFAIGAGTALVTGGLGYTIRTFMCREEFEWSDLIIEAGSNMISGMLSFVAAMTGGLTGIKG